MQLILLMLTLKNLTIIFFNYDELVEINHNPNWLYFPYPPYRN